MWIAYSWVNDGLIDKKQGPCGGDAQGLNLKMFRRRLAIAAPGKSKASGDKVSKSSWNWCKSTEHISVLDYKVNHDVVPPSFDVHSVEKKDMHIKCAMRDIKP